MIRRPAAELHFVKSKNPSPTIEVHSDSLKAQGLNLHEIASRTLASLAASGAKVKETIHIYGAISINFHQPAWSEFLIVPSSEKVLHALYDAFSLPGVKMRYSDYIRPSDGLRVFHIEDGRLWEPEDELTWFSNPYVAEENGSGVSMSSAPSDDDDGLEDDCDQIFLDSIDFGDDLDEEFIEEPADTELIATHRKAEQPSRYRAARSDAKVATIRQTIEAAFGLPEGSVALCAPDGRALRGDALIKTLRRRWEDT